MEARRIPITDKFIDSWGEEHTRGGYTDHGTLSVRYLDWTYEITGFRDDMNLRDWLWHAHQHYDKGEYAKALNYLNLALQRMPVIEPYIFYYIRVCARVLSIPLREKEIEYKSELEHYSALPKFLKWVKTELGFFTFEVRCKWCGRYNRYVKPNERVGLYNEYFNDDRSCYSCDCLCPMPSWIFDSPEGRAYCYYSGSYEHEDFYKEFEQDYEPKPLSKYSGVYQDGEGND